MPSEKSSKTTVQFFDTNNNPVTIAVVNAFDVREFISSFKELIRSSKGQRRRIVCHIVLRLRKKLLRRKQSMREMELISYEAVTH